MNYHPHVFVHMCYRTFHPIEEFIFVHLYGHFSKNIAHKISSFVCTHYKCLMESVMINSYVFLIICLSLNGYITVVVFKDKVTT